MVVRIVKSGIEKTIIFPLFVPPQICEKLKIRGEKRKKKKKKRKEKEE